VFITAGPITKLFAGGGGGEWTTCAMIDDELRPVWSLSKNAALSTKALRTVRIIVIKHAAPRS